MTTCMLALRGAGRVEEKGGVARGGKGGAAAAVGWRERGLLLSSLGRRPAVRLALLPLISTSPLASSMGGGGTGRSRCHFY